MKKYKIILIILLTLSLMFSCTIMAFTIKNEMNEKKQIKLNNEIIELAEQDLDNGEKGLDLHVLSSNKYENTRYDLYTMKTTNHLYLVCAKVVDNEIVYVDVEKELL